MKFNNNNFYLLFEGEYKDNYKYKGKEYYKNGKLKFEGEYLFTERWIGNIYDINGNIVFELNNNKGKVEDIYGKLKIFIGENLDEKKLNEKVKGKEYDDKGRLIFEGEYLNKEMWKGKINNYYEDELIFEGEYLDGKIWNGKGKEYNGNRKVTFEGEYINRKKNGYIKKYKQMVI